LNNVELIKTVTPRLIMVHPPRPCLWHNPVLSLRS